VEARIDTTLLASFGEFSPTRKYQDFKITGEEELQVQAFVTSTRAAPYWPTLRSGRRAHVINCVGDLLGSNPSFDLGTKREIPVVMEK